jgi:hypothetical protein
MSRAPTSRVASSRDRYHNLDRNLRWVGRHAGTKAQGIIHQPTLMVCPRLCVRGPVPAASSKRAAALTHALRRSRLLSGPTRRRPGRWRQVCGMRDAVLRPESTDRMFRTVARAAWRPGQGWEV